MHQSVIQNTYQIEEAEKLLLTMPDARLDEQWLNLVDVLNDGSGGQASNLQKREKEG